MWKIFNSSDISEGSLCNLTYTYCNQSATPCRHCSLWARFWVGRCPGLQSAAGKRWMGRKKAISSEARARPLKGLVHDDILKNKFVQELRDIDDQYVSLETQYKAELLQLRRAHAERCAPLLERRRQQLVTTPDESCAEEFRSSDACSSTSALLAYPRATPAIPGFWKIVLQNSAEFQEDIEEHDEPVLDYLSDITCEPLESDECLGFRLRMLFAPNPFFMHTELVKVYHTERTGLQMPGAQCQLGGSSVDSHRCVRIEAQPIEWTPGNNVTVEVITKKAKGGGRKKQSAMLREKVPRPSFFRTFFRSLGPDEDVPEEELEGQDSDDEDPSVIMDFLLSEDYEQALALRDFIVPHAVRWFTGDACDDDIDDDDDQEEEEEEEAMAVEIDREDEEMDDADRGPVGESGNSSCRRRCTRSCKGPVDRGEKR